MQISTCMLYSVSKPVVLSCRGVIVLSNHVYVLQPLPQAINSSEVISDRVMFDGVEIISRNYVFRFEFIG